jgi:hypothetical protein
MISSVRVLSVGDRHKPRHFAQSRQEAQRTAKKTKQLVFLAVLCVSLRLCEILDFSDETGLPGNTAVT